jgi:hypothetical protein
MKKTYIIAKTQTGPKKIWFKFFLTFEIRILTTNDVIYPNLPYFLKKLTKIKLPKHMLFLAVAKNFYTIAGKPQILHLSKIDLERYH